MITHLICELFTSHFSCESFYDIKDGRTPRMTSKLLNILILDKQRLFLFMLLTFIQINRCVFSIVSPFRTSYNNAVNDNHFQLRVRKKGATKREETSWKANYTMGRGVPPVANIIGM